MKVLDPGHTYLMDQLDWRQGEEPTQQIEFVKRCGPGYPGNQPGTEHLGVTVQEVCRVLIDRLQYVQGQANQMEDFRSAQVDSMCIEHLRSVIRILEHRAAHRHNRPVDPQVHRARVELAVVCRGCGHVGCAGDCGR